MRNPMATAAPSPGEASCPALPSPHSLSQDAPSLGLDFHPLPQRVGVIPIHTDLAIHIEFDIIAGSELFDLCISPWLLWQARVLGSVGRNVYPILVPTSANPDPLPMSTHRTTRDTRRAPASRTGCKGKPGSVNHTRHIGRAGRRAECSLRLFCLIARPHW